ncbi:Y-family DNA polymerase [Hansschlegelia plantiphila]|uniref:DNA-directed DNA polymerase n=1 Tax=Hansschlegelia plantiphila TaxID=374655 RepID=A0A9W6MVQ3_9HYPH|nr:DNA polymerase Y family protein [Hansschlegelia plantiphila]GLK68005.1 DNA-directed DNA polymerase [Hansschlegelia plantiphila]
MLPSLSIDRIRRREAAAASRSGEQDDRPLVVVDRVANALRIATLDLRAAQAGCRPCMPLAEARAVCLDVRAVPADPGADALLLEGIADWCERYTPLVALDPPSGLLLDVSGCAHFFGGEEALRADVVAALSARGFGVRAAVADTPGVARALARFTAGDRTEEDEAAVLGGLPIDALDPSEDVRIGLLRAGLTSVGAVARRGRGELAARFGAALVDALDRTLGRTDAPISPRRPAPSRLVERRFAEPVLALDAALAALRALADALGRRLEAAGEGLKAAEATFFRTDGRVARIAVAFGRATRDPDLVLRLLREKLDALADPLDPGFGFDLVRLSALAVETLAPEARSLDAAGDADQAVVALIDRLAARHGRRRILRYAPHDAHRPEAEARAAPAQAASATSWPQPFESEPPRRPLRMFAAPEAIDVIAEVPDGPPVRFVWRRVTHAVARAEGPERIALEWWRQDAAALTRDYFRVEDAEGARFWLYRDGLYVREVERPRWFLHGLFA